MHGGKQAGADLVGEDVPPPQDGHARVEPREPGEPAPVTVKPGEKLVHPVTGKDVAQGNPFPKKPTTNRRSWHRWLTGDKS